MKKRISKLLMSLVIGVIMAVSSVGEVKAEDLPTTIPGDYFYMHYNHTVGSYDARFRGTSDYIDNGLRLFPDIYMINSDRKDDAHVYYTYVTSCDEDAIKGYCEKYAESIEKMSELSNRGDVTAEMMEEQMRQMMRNLRTYTTRIVEHGKSVEKMVNLNDEEPYRTVKDILGTGKLYGLSGPDADSQKSEFERFFVVNLVNHSFDQGVVTTQPTCVKEGVKTYTCKSCGKKKTEKLKKLAAPVKNQKIKDTKGNSYTVKDAVKHTVTFKAPYSKKAKTVSIPSTVEVSGLKYSVVAIADKAFYKNDKITQLTVPSTVKTIGKNAFSKCKKLKTITIKSASLKSGNIGKNAFSGLPDKATIKVPKKSVKNYKNYFAKKGFTGRVKAY